MYPLLTCLLTTGRVRCDVMCVAESRHSCVSDTYSRFTQMTSLSVDDSVTSASHTEVSTFYSCR